MAERIRLLIREINAQESHEHTLRCRLLRSEGIDGERSGNDQ